jgi:L,D-peptidoglycan transpeptidase YkuD (ErfK/YbiS/YcfS/YnhG family)
MLRLFLHFIIGFSLAQVCLADGIPSNVRQLVVAVGDDWNSSSGKLQCFNRQRDGSWRAAFSTPVSVMFGKSGAAWGRGVYGQQVKGAAKREGDRRTPAGLFSIGKIYGYDATLIVNPGYPYRQVGQWDAWPDDPQNPFYNRHVVIDPKRGVPDWFGKQKMRHGDEAYHYLVEIRHNADPPKQGYGSAIFFHTRRGPGRTTAGCTTMDRRNLVSISHGRRRGNCRRCRR